MGNIVSEFYKNTNLWKNSLGDLSGQHADHITTLNATYQDFRNKAFELTSLIAKSLPDLTIHDGNHLDALWETADLIAGPSYPINPLEGFVLGGAILLHDAALCFEAYEGGQTKLRQTVEWRDCFAALSDRSNEIGVEQIKNDADFASLRLLHAKRAQELATASWNADGEQVFLIENSDLRRRYGALIGRIAASHHWPIEEVAALGTQFNAPGHLPREWRVDPVKIACLLRCADAAHLDSRRAPDFLMALTKRQGISSHHWTAQNWLARADISQQAGEEDTIVFTSNQDFSKDHTDAWWVAYDAIVLLQSEIIASNSLLASRLIGGSPSFKVTKIKGVSSPEEMSKYVRATGWEPCAAKIHVGNLEKLVNDLGGQQLYGTGDQLGVTLRELVQNSRDAIEARRSIDHSFEGIINIVVTEDRDGGTVLEVTDNGVGMSERVLTGPLLDFGSSFWVSNLVHDEFPGLRSSTFKSVGRFGIGFYSVFMVAESVSVSSRRWDAALSEVVTLDFSKGLTLRPTRSRGLPKDFSTSASTSVKLKMKPDHIKNGMVEIQRNRMGEKKFSVKLEDYIAALVCGIDVAVNFKGPSDDKSKAIHFPLATLEEKEEAIRWLEKTSFFEYAQTKVTRSDILKITERLRFVDPDDRQNGYAALSASIDRSTTFLSSRTVGGLSASVHGRGDDAFFGFLDYSARSAKREPEQTPRVSHEKLEIWANEQINLLEKGGVTDLERVILTSNLCNMKLDPLPIFRVLVRDNGNMYIFDLIQLFNLVKNRGLAVFKANFGDHIETFIDPVSYKDLPVFQPFTNSSFLSLEREGLVSKNAYSLLGCLSREAQRQGYQINVIKTSDVVQGKMEKCEVVILNVTLPVS